MTDNHHPITPPPELVQEWARYATGYNIPGTVIKLIATHAARWGADQELEACVEWIGSEGLAGYTSRELRAARRPKPPSLKDRIATAIAHGDNSIALALLDQALPD